MSNLEVATQEQKSFIQEWSFDRVKGMSLEEYTNSDKDTAFIYWLEKKTEHTGSIWGGSAFKFGIYKRRNTEYFVEKKMVKTDGVYAWLSKYGSTREAAFSNILNIIIRIVTASQSGNFEEINKIDLGDAVKWKIAFLYNPENIIPIFNPLVLRRAAESTGLEDFKKDDISAMQKHLFLLKPSEQNTFSYATILWSKYNLNNFFTSVEKFIEQGQAGIQTRKGYPSSYKGLEVKVGFGFGAASNVPWIAFLKAPNTVPDGIYPAFLYFKEAELLILAYGISETNKPKFNWSNEDELKSIKEWFQEFRSTKPANYGSSYVKAVYDLEEDLNPELVQSDLDAIINEYNKIDFGVPGGLEEPFIEYPTKRYWLISPGESGSAWEEFFDNGIVGIGWEEIGDLSNYSSRSDIRDQLKNLYPEVVTSQSNNALCLWEFSKYIKVGDIIIAKRGQSEYLEYGIVSSDYYYEINREKYKHLRKVEWKKKGTWEEPVHPIVVKTLTDITKYPDYVDRLKRLIGIEQEPTVDSEKIDYYWLNANPKFWKIEDFQVGQVQSYTMYNERGNKRSRFEYFEKIKPGDLVIGYETTPIQKVVAIFEVTQGAHLDEDTGKEEISFKVQKFLPNPLSYDVIKSMPELKNSEVMKNNMGSLFKLTKDEYSALINKDTSLEIDLPVYTVLEAQKELFLSVEEIENILNSLEYKKNIILQGPPGVGKTYISRRLAYLAMEEKDNSKIEMIQFHQSYSYEDFMQGFRPKEDGTFKLESGVFYRFCKRAQADPLNKYFFIIDEINRGNLSKIFGELMLLIELDKRGQENAVSLTYSVANENKFYIPSNLYLIGTMNTADRSLAVVDYAFRRRFAFLNIQPNFSLRFSEELNRLGVDETIVNPIIDRISSLNAEIGKDSNLGMGFRIGHSYFCNVPKDSGDDEWYNNIIRNEIAPLLQEYWFDNEEKAEVEISRLYLK